MLASIDGEDETVSDETPKEPDTATTPVSPETPAPAAETPAAETPPVAEEPPVAEDAAATAPTEETAVPAADVPPTAAAPVAAAPVAAAPVAAAPVKKERKAVAVPMSVLVALGAILVAALMFGIGYAVGDSNSNDNAVSTPIGNGNFPQFPNRGGNDNDTPSLPQFPGGNQQTPNQGGTGNNPNNNDDNEQASSPPFMGVATQQTQAGLEITEVVANSAADRAGLEVGDVITEFQGDAVTTPAQLANAVAQHEVGDRVEITYTRDGDTDTVTLTLGTRTTSN